MWLAWNQAAALAVALAVVGVAVRPTMRHGTVLRAVAKECAIVVALYAVWQLAGSLSIMKVTHALDRGRWIWRFERSVHLPSELAVQRAVLPHSLLVQAANAYYALVHGPSLIACLAWLFFRHREQYPRLRNTMAIVTGVSLAIQLVPVAPPRMLDALGFVDTGLVYHQSVYTQLGRGLADQLSAMPSVHVAWAVLISLAVIRAGTTRKRWLILLHPVATVLAVVVTANHFWLDGIVAVALIPPAELVQQAATALAARLRMRTAVPARLPALDEATTG